MTRVPIRLRVTLVFAVVMAVVLGATGLFLYLRLEKQLNESIDVNLRSRAGEVSALVRGAGGRLSAQGRDSLIEQEETFSQILTTEGRIVDSTPQLRKQAVLSTAELGRATKPIFFEREQLPGLEGSVRLLAAPVKTQEGELVAIVGSSLDDRDEALRNLAVLLLIGGPVALLLASLAGYWVARAALRPVDEMRQRAAAISASEPNERLPVPPARDELSRLGETLNEMLGRLEAALERERRFVDDASHELRTPLALHKAELEVALKYEADDSDELRAAVVSAIEEVDRLIQLAEDLLVVARSEEGRLAVNFEPISVADLFATLRERFGARAAQANRELLAEAGDDLRVEGDRLRLEQALTNMVDNGLRYGEGEVRLWAKPNAGGERVELHVSDRGQGFPPEFVERAFERFSRADSARSRGGSGLGLAIVETIARAHHGRAWATNDSDGGADVWIEIPASRA